MTRHCTINQLQSYRAEVSCLFHIKRPLAESLGGYIWKASFGVKEGGFEVFYLFYKKKCLGIVVLRLPLRGFSGKCKNCKS